MAKLQPEVLEELKETMNTITQASTFIAECEVQKAQAVADIQKNSIRQKEIIGFIEEKYGKESVLDIETGEISFVNEEKE